MILCYKMGIIWDNFAEKKVYYSIFVIKVIDASVKNVILYNERIV